MAKPLSGLPHLDPPRSHEPVRSSFRLCLAFRKYQEKKQNAKENNFLIFGLL